MKRKRLLSCILALLLVVSLLPMTVMAENNVPPSDFVPANDGTIDNNNGTIDKNYGTVVNNNPHGTVVNNNAGGTVVNNNDGGIVEHNNKGGTVVDNNKFGIVVNNNAGGTVENNNKFGIVENNSGLVGKKDNDDKLITDGTSGNSGLVQENKDKGVVVNNSGGKVETNTSKGDGTNPGVINNGGNVTTNQDGGTVVNNSGGWVGANRDGGTVVNNSGGTVKNNYSNGDGTNPGVINNGGYVASNQGTVDNLAGQVMSNNESGKILNNYGIVGEGFRQTDPSGGPWSPDQFNVGTVVTNHMSGEVTNNTFYDGVVEKNYGTVYDTPGEIKATYYGLHGEDADTDTMYTEEGYQYGHEAGTDVNLDEKAASYQRKGYKLSSYTVWTYDKTSTAADKLTQQTVTDTKKYTINAPTLLKLVWEKIASAVKPAPAAPSGGEAGAVKTSAGKNYIGLGSVVTLNGSRYKVVEIKDDAYVVVTFDALPDEDVKDLNALFAALFTPEQQKQIQNLGQLLDAEDVLSVFGKPGNHPVFEFSKALLKK